jgi:hypothetical protein
MVEAFSLKAKRATEAGSFLPYLKRILPEPADVAGINFFQNPMLL